MTEPVHEPPRLAQALLRRLMPDGVAGLTMLGDLLEGFEERARHDGIAAARRWYRWQTLALAVYVLTTSIGQLARPSRRGRT